MERRRWLLLIGGGLLLSHALRLGFFTYGLAVVLVLAVVGQVMGRRGAGDLTLGRHCPVTRAQIGQEVPVRVQLRHVGPWPFVWLLYEDLLPEGLDRRGRFVGLTTLWPGRTVGLGYTIQCPRRGYYQLGPLLLETGDLFGLCRRFEALGAAHWVTVHPTLYPVDGEPVGRPRAVGEVRVEQRLFEDPSRLRGVRPFQPGDKLSRLHWRASARTGALQTRVYEPRAMAGAMLCCDLFEPAYEGFDTVRRSELAISAAASLAAWVVAGGQRAGLLSNGRDAADRARRQPADRPAATRAQARQRVAMAEHSARLRPCEVPPGRGDAALQQLLDATARLELSDFQTLGALLAREYPRLPRELIYLLVTPRLDRPLVDAAVAMRRSGFAAAVIRIDHADPAPALQGALLEAGVRVYDVARPSQLQQFAGGFR